MLTCGRTTAQARGAGCAMPHAREPHPRAPLESHYPLIPRPVGLLPSSAERKQSMGSHAGQEAPTQPRPRSPGADGAKEAPTHIPSMATWPGQSPLPWFPRQEPEPWAACSQGRGRQRSRTSEQGLSTRPGTSTKRSRPLRPRPVGPQEAPPPRPPPSALWTVT